MAKQIQETDECQEILEQIEAQEKELWTIALRLNTSKLEAKEHQKAFDHAIAELRRLARTRFEDNPLFSADKEEEADD